MARELKPSQIEIIDGLLETGRFSDADDVFEQALAMLKEQAALEVLRGKLQIGLDQLDRGEWIEFTPEWRAARLEEALQRAAAGEMPDPDVCP